MPLRVLEAAFTFDLPDTTVAVAGDWHGNAGWVGRAIPALGQIAPEVDTILHVGDFWPTPQLCSAIDTWCGQSGIARVLVTLGNHEPYGDLTPLLDAHRWHAVRLSESVWVLPRPFRFTVAGIPFLSLGGAASVDAAWRVPGRDWWPDEAITDGQVEAAIEGGPATVMITHESPSTTPVESVLRILSSNPLGFPPRSLAYSAASREQVGRVWDAVRPSVLFHGHMHAPGVGATTDGREVVSLGMDDQPGNLALLDVTHMTVELVEHSAIIRR